MKISFMFLLTCFFYPALLFGQSIQWQQINGPHGGTAVSFASNANGDVFVGSSDNNNGVNRSIDGGLTWLMSSNGISVNDRSVEAILVTPNNNIICGTESSNGSKNYRSTNNGDSWYETNSDFGAKSFALNNNGEIYSVETDGTAHKSTDDGITWQLITSVPAGGKMDIAINNSGDIFLTGAEILRSTDNGTTWANIGNGYITPGAMVTSIVIDDSGHIFAGCRHEYSSSSGILKSTDNGDTWAAVITGIKIGDHHNLVINNQGHIFAGSYGWGVWKSTDGGFNWTQNNSGLQHFYLRSMHCSNGILFAGTEGGGIYRSDDEAETWVQVGFNGAVVKKISINPQNGNLFTAVSGISRSTDSGQSWQPVNIGLSNYETKTFVIKNDGTLFCGAAGGSGFPPPKVFRSLDNGNSWVEADTGLTGSPINAMAIDQDGNIYAGDFDGVYESTNNGNNWFSIGGPGGAIGLAFNSAGDLFLTRGQEIWRKSYGDPNWVQMSNPALWWFNISLYIGSNDYIYSNQFRSTDNGETWTQMNSLEANASAFVENSSGYLFAGHGYGVYRSTNYGDDWTQVNDGLAFTDVLSLGIDSDDYLYAGTNGRSIFKTTTSTISNIEKNEFVLSAFNLSQNYPNPFNPSTTIKYIIPERCFISLKVFDVLGNEVATLFNKENPAGIYKVEFDGRRLSSGVYFYQLKAAAVGGYAGNFSAGSGRIIVQTKKMILLK